MNIVDNGHGFTGEFIRTYHIHLINQQNRAAMDSRLTFRTGSVLPKKAGLDPDWECSPYLWIIFNQYSEVNVLQDFEWQWLAHHTSMREPLIRFKQGGGLDKSCRLTSIGSARPIPAHLGLCLTAREHFVTAV